MLLRTAVLLLACAFAFPGVYLLHRGFAEGADLTVLLSRRTLGPLWRSLRLAFSVSAAAAVLGTILAWVNVRTDLPGARIWRVLLPLPLVFPSFIGAAAFINALNPGGLANDILASLGVARTPEFRGFRGAWTVLTLMTYPYVYLPVAARARQLPSTLEESARLLGQSSAGVIARVCIPQMATSVGAGTLLVFLYTLSDFGAVQLMRYDTLTRAVYTNQLASPPTALSLSLMLLGLSAVVVVAERFVSRRLPSGPRSETSIKPLIYSLGRWRWPVLGFVCLSLAAAVGAPLVSLLDWAADGMLRSARGGRPLTVGAAKVLDATGNTLAVSVVAAVMSVAAVLPVALLAGRYRSKMGSLAHALVISTFALPGLLIALSVRFWILRSDLAFSLLDDTTALLLFAYVARFGSLAIGAVLVAVCSVPSDLHESARTLGAGRLRRFAVVDLPLMGPGLLAAAGLVLLSVMKELPISLLVSPLGFSTLATRIFSSFEDAFVAEAGIMAVVLVTLSLLLTWFLVIRRSDML